MEVGLLLSIDRRELAEEAMQTVALAKQFHGRGVSGLDLSGNPMLGSWSTWRPALDAARQAGLYVSLHAGEVSQQPAATHHARQIQFMYVIPPRSTFGLGLMDSPALLQPAQDESCLLRWTLQKAFMQVCEGSHKPLLRQTGGQSCSK